VTETKFIHNRMRNVDRRYQNNPFLFFLKNHQDMKSVNSYINFSTRKSKKFDSKAFVEAVFKNDTNFDVNVSSIFPQLKGHAGYWRQRKLELDNMCKYF